MVGTNYLNDLSNAQRSAVEYLDGPELVIAGAGSGKTRVLTYKVMHLLSLGYEPYRTMALTFTNKAAEEMRSRVASLVGADKASQLWMGTFHSIFLRMLRRHAGLLGFSSNFTIYDTADSKTLINSIIKEHGLKDRFKPNTVLNEISNAKNNLIDYISYAGDKEIARVNAEAGMSEMSLIYSEYCERTKSANAMDFDDILLYTDFLLRDNPTIRDKYRDFFRYILVDEYQDTNFAQHLIIRQLSETKGAVCVVGDDAQSIYSFRGANIRNILDLQKYFPSLRTFKLEQNYRSTSTIVEAANSLIAKNIDRIPKSVYSERGKGDRIEVAQAYDDFEEGRIVANGINKVCMRNGDNYSDIAVLYRTNSQSRIFEEALRNRNIPYRVFGGVAFYQRKEIKDAIAYFRLAVNPNDNEAMRRIINVPARKIGDRTVEKISSAASSHKVSFYSVLCNPGKYGLDVNRSTFQRLSAFAAAISSFVELNKKGDGAVTLAEHIISKTGLLAQYITDGDTPENISKRDNILELIKGIQQRADQLGQEAPDAVYTMGEFLSEISLLTDADIVEDGNVVTLMTMHASKGLEFESIFIVGVEEDIIPSSHCTYGPHAAQEIEEERRLMYVALTRAKRYCMMSFARKRLRNGMFVNPSPSRFLTDIDPRYLRMLNGASLQSAPISVRYSDRRQQRPLDISSLEFQPGNNAPTSSGSHKLTSDVGDVRIHSVAETHAGMRILHSRFGEGVINSVDDAGMESCLLVTFGDGTQRRLMLRFAKFKIL